MRMNRWIVTLAIAAILAAAMGLQAQAPKKQATAKKAAPAATQTVTSHHEVLRGTDNNIKGTVPPSPAQSADKPAPAPPQKGGERPRGPQVPLCRLTFDNWTGWWVQVFVDGEYRGTMAPYDDITTYPVAGTTRAYARAVFTDGTVYNWPTQTFNCKAGEPYVWKIEN